MKVATVACCNSYLKVRDELHELLDVEEDKQISNLISIGHWRFKGSLDKPNPNCVVAFVYDYMLRQFWTITVLCEPLFNHS